ncbi:hypothetical protein ACLB2K_000871 [Fragaria x ananassa]
MRPNYKELYFKRTPNTSVFINGGRANPQRLLNNEEEEEAVATDRGNGNPIGAPNLGRSSRRLHNRRRFPVSLQVARTVKEVTAEETRLQREIKQLSKEASSLSHNICASCKA